MHQPVLVGPGPAAPAPDALLARCWVAAARPSGALAFERSGLGFVVNFHVENSRVDYRFGVPQAGGYRGVVSLDNAHFGGFDRPDEAFENETFEHQLRLYVPSRVALALARG